MSKKVTFQGQSYWLITGGDETEGALLAYPEHCDEQGDILPEHIFSDSYAHVYPSGGILRYGSQIGTAEELEFL